MTDTMLIMLTVGDIILSRPDPDSYFSLVAPVLKSADIVVGQGEIPFTDKPVFTAAWSAIAAPTINYEVCPSENMKALKNAGFNVIHLAGNHIWDAGIPGIEDTIAGLKKLDIAFCGAGMNINESRKPAVVKRKGTKIGFLDYNCAGPKETWANANKPGCAYIHIITCYELDHPTPGGGPTIYSFAEPKSLRDMVDDIQKLRDQCDILVACYHMGMGFAHAKVSMYERQVAYAAIDAGADLVLAEHAHVLKGIEQYKGKTIFYGLSDFIWNRSPREITSPEETEFRQKKLKECFPFSPTPDESKQTIIAKCIIDNKKIVRVSYLPCLINDNWQPEVLQHDQRGQKVFNYMDMITREAELNAKYKWDGDEVVIFTV
jgi:poly-gamma-glutamate capsule biosynthesis protein CapA/YwtB (metallophosphatase superfamily)